MNIHIYIYVKPVRQHHPDQLLRCSSPATRQGSRRLLQGDRKAHGYIYIYMYEIYVSPHLQAFKGSSDNCFENHDPGGPALQSYVFSKCKHESTCQGPCTLGATSKCQPMGRYRSSHSCSHTRPLLQASTRKKVATIVHVISAVLHHLFGGIAREEAILDGKPSEDVLHAGLRVEYYKIEEKFQCMSFHMFKGGIPMAAKLPYNSMRNWWLPSTFETST